LELQNVIGFVCYFLFTLSNKLTMLMAMSRSTKRGLQSFLLLAGMYLLTVYLNRGMIAVENTGELADLQAVAFNKFTQLIERIEKETEWKVEIISAKRTKERQAELKEENPKNASPETSKHVKGLAIDINLFNPFTFQRLKKASSKAEWQAAGVDKLADELGLEWGGNYRNYHDPVHFELP
jgi:hypothetical protein